MNFSGELRTISKIAAYAALGPLALGGGVARAHEAQTASAAVGFEDGANDLNFSPTIDVGDRTEVGPVVSILNLDCDDPALSGYEDAYSSSGTIYTLELPPFGDSQVIGEVESWGQGEEPRVYDSALMATALNNGDFLITPMDPEMGSSSVINLLDGLGKAAVYTNGEVQLSFEVHGSYDDPGILGTVACLDEEKLPTKVIPQIPNIFPESADPSIA